MTETRQLAEDMLKAINEGSGSARALVVTLLVLSIYVFIVVSGTNDEQLLRNSTVAVPTLSNATVPASAFYAVMPWAFVSLHLDLLLHLSLLSEKLHRFNEAVEGLDDPDVSRDLRLRLAGFPFSNWLGRDPHGSAGLRRLQGVTVWSSLVLLPLLALIYLQLGFLAFHSEVITWGQRLALLLDVGLLYYFWPRLVDGRYRRAASEKPASIWPGRQQMITRRVGLLLLLLAVLDFLAFYLEATTWGQRLVLLLNVGLLYYIVSHLVVGRYRRHEIAHFSSSWPGQRTEKSVPGFTWCRVCCPSRLANLKEWAVVAVLILLLDLLRLGLLAMLRRLRQPAIVAMLALPLLFISLLVATIPDEAVDKLARGMLGEYDNLPVEKRDSPACQAARAWRSFAWRLIEACEEISQNESLSVTLPTLALFHLDGSWFHRSLIVRGRVLTGDELRSGGNTQERGLDLRKRDLRYADFAQSSFPAAQMKKTRLSYANLSEATLTAANLSEATLTGTDLNRANLTGAKLSKATLTGANLSSADLTSADLRSADLTCADLSMANLTGASLSEASLTAANLSSANLTGTSVSYKQVGVFWIEKPFTVDHNLKELQKKIDLLNKEAPPPERRRERFEYLYKLTELHNKSMEVTRNLDISSCLGEGCSPTNMDSNARVWASAYQELACPFSGTRLAEQTKRGIAELTEAFSMDHSELDKLPPTTRTALRTAARQALLELARGPCADDLAKHIPEDIRAEAQQNKPRSP